jgi:nickel-dependent lactate racemase
LGEYHHNPARQDVEEIGAMIGIDLALNAILNGKKEIVRVLAGDPVEVMHEAMPLVLDTYVVPVQAPYDLMIVSPGGHPKDINMYQAQKGLAHAMSVMKDGGIVILCAACPEAAGSTSYLQWVTHPRMKSHHDVLAHFEDEGFRVGPHKAFQISRDASRVNLMLVSDMEPGLVRQLLLQPMPNLQEALESVLPGLSTSARIGVLPAANSTIPMPG